MKNKIFKCLAISVLFVMIFTQSSFASSGNVRTYIPLNSVMNQSVTGVTRTTDFSYVLIYSISIYPRSGEDTYEQCYFRLYHNSIGNTPISSKYKITEGKTYKLYITEGYLSVSKVDICVAGNDPDLDAYVSYSYNGK